MRIQAEIRGMSCRPLLCRARHAYTIEELEKAFEGDGAFTLHFDRETAVAASWWLSPKRTRSYPYARIYDTLNFQGKRVTFIPILKDESRDGNRDFLQWDTVSLMSLLGRETPCTSSKANILRKAACRLWKISKTGWCG